MLACCSWIITCITVQFIKKNPTRCNSISKFIIPYLCEAQRVSGWPDYDQQHCYHHAPTVTPEAATAVVELLMMGVRTPETC
jgi:hypothetical protein